ncbi:hypothetical protein ACFFF7_00885 [Novosphingobium aquiterrae]|uniref:DUF2834 domain-containing protein n=1 Tax=Novosphingobium aquiterrae TaxID=624388 RepID=A0ABV6PDR0_9SPHN
MTTFEMLFTAGLVVAVGFIGLVAARRTGNGDWRIAGLIGAAFAGYSMIPILREGPTGFYPIHVVNFWGVQVWFDLALSLSCAVFLAAPRARCAGMALAPWLLLVLLGGSIGLLALLTRLFWLERNAPTQA